MRPPRTASLGDVQRVRAGWSPLLVVPVRWKNRQPPQGASSLRHRRGAGRLPCRLPGGRAPGRRVIADPGGGCQREARVERKHGRRRAADAPVVPLPGRVTPEMSPRLCTGGCQLPTVHAPGQNLPRGPRPRWRPAGWGRPGSGRLAAQAPPTRPWGQPRVRPDGGRGGAVDPTCVLALARRPRGPAARGGAGPRRGARASAGVFPVVGRARARRAPPRCDRPRPPTRWWAPLAALGVPAVAPAPATRADDALAPDPTVPRGRARSGRATPPPGPPKGGAPAPSGRRPPLAGTKGAGDERTGSRELPWAALRSPRRRAMVSSLPLTTGAAGAMAARSRPRSRQLASSDAPWARLRTRWACGKWASAPVPLTGSTAVPVRVPGASLAPTSQRLAWANTRLEHSAAKAPITGMRAMGIAGIGPRSEFTRVSL
jgi:hypothetical protein